MVSSDQRRRQLAREKFLRQQQRRENARRRARTLKVSVSAALVVLVGLGTWGWAAGGLDSAKSDDSAAAKPTSPPKPSKAPDPCDKPAKGKVADLTFKKEPEVTIDKSATYTLSLKTTCGDMPISMDASKAPHTVNSFDFLAKKGFFDHTKCHRLTTAGIFVLQCGDPKGDGTGGPGYTIPDENLKDERLKSKKDSVYPAGTVAMANQYNPQTKQGKNSGGSQFFLVFQDSKLPAYYTPFGTLSKDGMKVLTKIAKAGETSGQGDGAPNATVVIDKATVEKS